MREQKFISPMLFMLVGLLIWAAHFTVIYGFNALACARGFETASIGGLPAVPLGVIIVTLLALGCLAVTGYLAWNGRQPVLPNGSGREVTQFVRQISLLGVAIAALGVTWEAIPAFLIPPCA